MGKILVTPKYLTKEIAMDAVEVALAAVMGDNSILRGRLKRQHCHIVVLVPATEYARPDYPIQPYAFYQLSVGEESAWEHPYDEIARSKAFQLWQDRNDDRTTPIPHLLFPGDTPFWGGVKRRGIVVACSGVQPWFDKMISGMVADIMVALAQDAFENDEERKAGAAFLS